MVMVVPVTEILVLVLRKADKLAIRYNVLKMPFAHIVALSRVSLLLCYY